MIYRISQKNLKNWKNSKERNVLLVRGARQVGKTFLVRWLGKSFRYFLEVNFEEAAEAEQFFDGSLNPLEICPKLSAYFNVPIVPGKTLLFFDEIQACPNALRSLRFFREKMPDLHMVAAGSLLEFALAEIPSFGVGRITSLFIYPMTFGEFLIACGDQGLNDYLSNANASGPLDETIHQRLLDRLRIHTLIGGMPAVVKSFCASGDIRSSQDVIDEILTSLRDDFAKYRRRLPLVKLQETFDSIAFQAGSKFKYSRISSNGSFQGYKDALSLLVNAGLAYRIRHTSARGLPLGGQVNPKRFKVIPCDMGLYQRVLGLDVSRQILRNDFQLVNKGSLAEVMVGLELVASSSSLSRPQLFYWHREAKGSNAEVDYVVQKDADIIPIEVKAGSRGRMQSLKLFMEVRGLERGIRLSQENFGKVNGIQIMPIYATQKILA